MDWLILILGVPAILIPLVLLFGFAGCGPSGVFCTDNSECPGDTVCFEGSCVSPVDPPLSAPENLAAIALDDHSVALTWTSDNPAGTIFQIERTPEDGEEFEAIPPGDLDDVSAAGATDRSRGLQEGVTFIYRVGAASEQEDPKFSEDTSSATVLPAAPVNLRATPVDIDRIKLSWDNASAVATDFILEHRLPGGTFDGGKSSAAPTPPLPIAEIPASLRDRRTNTASSPSSVKIMAASRTTYPRTSNRRRRRSHRRGRSRSPRCSRRRPGR